MDIELHRISFKYSKTFVLKEVSLTIPTQRIAAVVGNNGDGKTTFLHLLATILKPCSGYIKHTLKNPMCTFQTPVILNRTVMQNVVHTTRSLKVQNCEHRALDALEKVHLLEKKDAPAHTLSGGQKMRLQMARLIACDSQLWLLDEPYGGLDFASAKDLDTILLTARKNRITIFVATHNIDFIRTLADAVYTVGPCGLVREVCKKDFVENYNRDRT